MSVNGFYGYGFPFAVLLWSKIDLAYNPKVKLK